MSTKSLTIDARIPPPARRLTGVVQQLGRMSPAQAVRAIHDGAVRVNRRLAKRPQQVLELGDTIDLELSAPAPAAPPVKKLPRSTVTILFEDQHLVVVKKPPGLLTVPTPYREPQTVISQLNQQLERRAPRAEAFCVHRLDRGVSGVLVFAKSLEIAQRIRDQFAARKPQRRYLALVAGDVSSAEGTIRSHLATDKQLNRYSTADESAGELAVTHYRVLQRWPGVTLVEVRLETGRRNQIRVHFAEMGHPVLGDRRYGAERAAHPGWAYRRIALHAESLGFTHPVTGREMEFHVPPPTEFRRLEEKLNRSRRQKK